ncbi:protein-tyrosine phosphatase [Thermoleophilum album]|uniref:protein-tyrosine-phosphatase n=1 Tax=Thermoleophilum album TaxID=29539 RepID=A0A1H6FIP2_THEAL|nr:protein-tyrosine phosphatase [Thermoleophilum album]
MFPTNATSEPRAPTKTDWEEASGRFDETLSEHGVIAGRVDLHFHLLPAIDDGPASVREALALARAARADGAAAVVCTPHLRRDHVHDPRQILRAVVAFRSELRRAQVDLTILAGAEVAADLALRLDPRLLELVALGGRADAGRVANSRFLLVETPFDGLDAAFASACEALLRRGYRPILAHPELAEPLPAGERRLIELVRRGALVQVNALSLIGRHGAIAERRALDLVERRLAHLVASDAHGPTRPPALSAASAALLAHGFAPRHVRRLVNETPWRLAGADAPNVRPCPPGLPSPPSRAGRPFSGSPPVARAARTARPPDVRVERLRTARVLAELRIASRLRRGAA